MYDYKKKVGGMAHVVHADSGEHMKSGSPGKFADVAVPKLVSMLTEKGANVFDLKAKISGGANMFPSIDQDIMKIGLNNIEAVKQSLKKQRIPVVAEDIGGEVGRRIEFMVGPNKLIIRLLSGESSVI
jgi:chemotaxis protein CheD